MLCPNSASGLSRILYIPKGNGSPDRHLTLGTQDRATPTINGRARCYRRKNGPQRESRLAGAVEKEPSRERLARPPRTERIPGEGGVSNIFGSVSLPVFFFQAEDGIRDRSPSRGLGDVYKRQTISNMQKLPLCKLVDKEALLDGDLAQMGGLARSPNLSLIHI